MRSYPRELSTRVILSEAESKDPAAKLKRNATGFLASLGLTSVRHDFILS